MTEADLNDLLKLEADASAAPWHVMFTNDDAMMSAVFVLKNPSVGRVYQPYGDSPDADDVVAACLLSEPDIASVDDRRWDANATLIATVRNKLPELLRLAYLGLVAEAGRLKLDDED